MPVSINNTTLTFNDATTMTTRPVTSITAGSGISVSASTGAVTITNTASGISAQNCSYTGSLVEVALSGRFGPYGEFGYSWTTDVGSNRVVVGMRQSYNGCGNYITWFRAYNIKNTA